MDDGLAVAVIHASAEMIIQQAAGDVGVIQQAGIHVFQLVQAAFGAPVA